MPTDEDQYAQAERYERENEARRSMKGPILLGLMMASRTIQKSVLVVALCLIGICAFLMLIIGALPGVPAQTMVFPFLGVLLGFVLIGYWVMSKLAAKVGKVVLRDIERDWKN